MARFPPKKIGVLADDLTGAADAALALAEQGFRAEIAAPLGPLVPPPRSVQAWVLDTESRTRSPQEAAHRVRRALRALQTWGADVFYKKMDSTLRGPVGAEVGVFLMDINPSHLLPVVPAFPQAGRTVTRGILRVDGVPLHRTPFGKDPRHPRWISSVPDILKLTRAQSRRVVIPDVDSAGALERIARETAHFSAMVGSAGFLSALAKRWGRGRAPCLEKLKPRRSGAVVAGSAHPRTREQLAFLVSKMGALQKADAQKFFIVQASGPRRAPERVMKDVLKDAHRLGKGASPFRWVVTGGETAFGLINDWGQSRWRVVSRVDTGVPLCRSVSGLTREIVMKPGGFGKRDVFWKALVGHGSTPSE